VKIVGTGWEHLPRPTPIERSVMTEAREPLSEEGRELLALGRPLDAVDVLRQAVAAGEPAGADLLVQAYLDSGSWHAAAEWLAPLVEQGHVRFAGRLGVALAEIGDAVRAETALRLAVDSGELAASNDLAILLRDGSRLGEAIHVLRRAAEEGDGQAPANLVELHLEDGDLGAAIEVAEHYADEQRPETVVALADVRAQQRKLEEADQLYRRAAELGALRAHTAYGQFRLTDCADPAGAEREFRLAERHNEPGWAYLLGRFLVDDGRPDEARYYLRIAAGWGDRAALAALDELDGEDPTDD
jgi:TPR repeat protein